MNTILIVLFGLLQVADGAVTYLGLSFANLDEANPALAPFVSFLGLGGSITLFKLVGLAFVLFLFLDRHRMKNPWITATLASSVSFYSWVVSNNASLVINSVFAS